MILNQCHCLVLPQHVCLIQDMLFFEWTNKRHLPERWCVLGRAPVF